MPDRIIGITGAGVTRGRIRTHITTRVQELNSRYAETGSHAGSPFFYLLMSSRKRREMHAVFLGDAHRKSGVFSLCFALSPVESCSPPELVELTPQIYSSVLPNARKQLRKTRNCMPWLWKKSYEPIIYSHK